MPDYSMMNRFMIMNQAEGKETKNFCTTPYKENLMREPETAVISD